MKKTLFMAVMAAIMILAAAPAAAQSHKDKKQAKKENWEMKQQQQREEAELRHKLRMDSLAQAGRDAAAARAREEAERARQEAEAKAEKKRREAEEALREVEVNEPCSEYESDASTIRGRGVGEDLDQQFSVDLARTAALENMASQMSTKINGVLLRKRQQAKSGNTRASMQKTEDMVRTEVEETTGYRVVCKKTVTFYEDNQRVYKTYMVVELSGEGLLRSLFDKIQGDDEMRLDINFEQFQQEFGKKDNEQ